MRAVVHDRYGPPEVLRVDDVERPVPGDGEVLIRVHATTVNRTDCAVRAAKPFIWRFFKGPLRPRQRVLGMELAGEVEAVGASVSGFEVGDRVFGVKASGGQLVGPGAIIVRQVGTVFRPGRNVRMGRDCTLYAMTNGRVRFLTRGRVEVDPVPTGS